ncbi:MAG: hypothetical protein AB8B86_06770 [Pseudomonadales bacterium]
MFSKRVLLLSNYHIQAYHVTRGRIIQDVKLDLDENYWPVLKAYLAKDLRSPLYLVTNILEEEFQLEKVPHTSGRDRKALLGRKLDQMFRGETFANYKVVGRDKKGRKDDHVLFHTMHESALLNELLEHIYELELALAGLYSVPLLMQQCLRDILPDSNILVLAEVDNHSEDKISFRQCFFTDGSLSLTRLVTFNLDESRNITEELADEVDGSRRYLTSHRILDPNAKLTTLVLECARTVSVTGRIELPAEFEVQYASPERIAELLNLRCVDDNTYFDDVLAGDLCRRSTARHYGTEESLYHHRHHQARWGIAIASACIACFVALLGGSYILEGYTIHEGNMDLQEVLVEERHQIELLEQSTPILPQSPEQMEASVQSVEWLQHNTMPPERVMSEISASLRLFPDIVLSEISWRRQNADDNDSMASAPIAAPVDGSMPDMNTEPGAATRQQEKYHVALKGSKSDYVGDLRNAISRIESFGRRLKANESVLTMNIVKLPMDVSAEASVRGEISGMLDKVEQGSATFEIELTLVSKNETTYL